MQRVFRHISQVNLWESRESISGRGSEFEATAVIRSKIPEVLREFNINTVLDAPCGDFNWMRHVISSEISYVGLDIVPGIIEQNRQRYENATTQFKVADITKSKLPGVDLIICRDCLVHLSLWHGSRALQQFKQSGAKYLLTTTYPVTMLNLNTPNGSWRALNLTKPPFNFPEPLELIPDPNDDTQKHPDKSLGLWKLADITPFTISQWQSPDVMVTNLIRAYLNPSWRL